MSEPAGGFAQLKKQSRALDHVRQGLQTWMRTRLEDPSLTVGSSRPPGGTGVANETLLFDVQNSTSEVDGYVVRLSTPDSLYLDYDLTMHYRMYEAMMASPTVPSPAVVGYEPDPDVLGAPFFVMEKIDGVHSDGQPVLGQRGLRRRGVASSTARAVGAHRALHGGVAPPDSEPFLFLRTGATDDGVGDCLEYWMRSLRWAKPSEPVPLTDEAEQWLLANLPAGTALSWGDSRLPNVIYRDYTPVGLLDWDLASLAWPRPTSHGGSS